MLIKPLKDLKEKYIKALIYGRSGSGKTTLCTTAPGKVLYICTEKQGIASFSASANINQKIDIAMIETLKDLRSVITEVKKNNCYETICFDSITEAQRLIVDEYSTSMNVDTKSKQLQLTAWNDVITRTRGLIRTIRDIEANIIVTALSEESIITKGGENDIVIKPSIVGKSLNIEQFFNIVGYSFKNEIDNNEIYCVYFSSNKNVITKGFKGLSKKEVPDFSIWCKKIQGENNGTTKKSS